MRESRKTLQELSLMDDFLMTESMLHKETAEPIAKMIIERTTGIKVGDLIIEYQKTVNGIDTNRHGVRLDMSLIEVDMRENHTDKVRVYDIEPNNRKDVSLPRRSRFYQALEDVKLLGTGVDYERLPELWSIWILPYDPFGKNQMVYTVKNTVEDFDDIDYNDGIRKWFLYTDGEQGGSPELKSLLLYLKSSRAENAVDQELSSLHAKIEKLKNTSEIGVRYMHVRENLEFYLRSEIKEGVEKGIEERLKVEIKKELAKREEEVKKELAKREEEAKKELAKREEEAKKEAKAQGLEQGEMRKLITQVCKKLQKGKSVAEIAEELEEGEERIFEICQAAAETKPAYQEDEIYIIWKNISLHSSDNRIK